MRRLIPPPPPPRPNNNTRRRAPSPAPEPRGFPAPPARNQTNNSNNNNEQQAQQSLHSQQVNAPTVHTMQQSPSEWLLKVKRPRHPNQNPHSNNHQYAPTILEILVTSDMTSEILSNCLEQVCGTHDNGHSIHGLFVDPSGPFVSLGQLLSAPQQWRHTIFCLYPSIRPPRPVAPPTLWYHEPAVVAAMIVSGTILIMSVVAEWRYGLFSQTVAWLERVLWSPHAQPWDEVLYGYWVSVHHVTMELPLQELYRFGPSWLGGWEGDSLPHICRRITFHGDRVFWERNYTECQALFENKQKAFVRFALPMVYGVVFIGSILAIRFISGALYQMYLDRVFAERRRQPPPDMVETYRAFQVILRQIREALVQDPRGRPPPSNGMNDNNYGRRKRQ